MRRKSDSQRKKERLELLNFRAFRRDCPDFGERVKSCRRGGDPPDFVCRDAARTKIGVELAEWVDQETIGPSKRRYDLEESYTNALQDYTELQPTNVGMVRIYADLPLPIKYAEQFRNEILNFIKRADDAWKVSPEWNDPQGIDFTDFAGYPVLQMKMRLVTLYPISTWPEDRRTAQFFRGINFEARGGAYSPDPMVRAAIRCLRAKAAKYAKPRNRSKLLKQNLKIFCLLIYYDQAVLHNTPYHAPHFGLEEIGAALTAELRNIEDHPFTEVYLYSPTEKLTKAIRVWPAAQK
jgi:hypothetical protein